MTFKRYNTRFGDHELFMNKMKPVLSKLQQDLLQCTNSAVLDEITEQFITSTARICKKTYKLIKPRQASTLNWWTTELQIERKKVRAMRKRYQRAKEEDKLHWKTVYNKHRAIYKKNINLQRLTSWKQFCTNSIKAFDKPYKLACKKKTVPINNLLTNLSKPDGTIFQNAQQLLQELYPQESAKESGKCPQPTKNFISTNRIIEHSLDPPFTISEILSVSKHLPQNKAPGFDGLDYRIVKRVLQCNPLPICSLYNKCLDLLYFPKSWKIGVLLLFLKPGKESTNLDSYRPIILLPTFGKLLEKLMTQRLNYYLSVNNYLSPNQYGFREGKSTEDAIETLISRLRQERGKFKHVAIVALDIKGAFDSVKHHHLKDALLRTPCPSNIISLYVNLLHDRTITLQTHSGPATCKQLQGTAQGSCSAPVLWNILLDGLLRIPLEQDSHLQAFADDLILLVSHKTRDGLGEKTTKELGKIVDWLQNHDLNLSTEKTQYVLFSSLLSYPTIKLQNKNIVKKSAIKYLGIWLDDKLSWDTHIQQTRLKANRILQNLRRTAGPSWGMRNDLKNTQYRMVTERMVSYGAATWFCKPTVTQKNKINSLQRPFLLHSSGAYHTTSTLALQIVTNNAPLSVTLSAEATFNRLRRFKEDITFGNLQYRAQDVENRIYGWSDHPSTALSEQRIKLTEFDFSIQNVTASIIIFTDGSRMESGTGAAFCAFENGNIIYEQKLRLPKHATIFQAEATAIDEAISWTASTHPNAWIYSDSQSVLMAIKQEKHHNSIIRSINRNLKYHQGITLQWTKAHIGTAGNEHADALAKEATTDLQAKYIYCPISYATVRKDMHKEITMIWQNIWSSGNTGRKIYQIKRTVPHFRKQKPWDKLIIQLLSEHGPFPAYLHRFKLRNSDLCACGQVGTAPHYLTSCPLTISFHMSIPSNGNEREWRKNLLNNPNARKRALQLMTFITENRDLIIPNETMIIPRLPAQTQRRRSRRIQHQSDN